MSIKTYWKNIRMLWGMDLDTKLRVIDSGLDCGYWKLKELELVVKELSKLKASASSLCDSIDDHKRKQVLDMHPIDLFKENREDFYTTKAIAAITELDIRSVQWLTSFRANDFLKLPNVGQKTVGYIQHCLARHGLKLAD